MTPKRLIGGFLLAVVLTLAQSAQAMDCEEYAINVYRIALARDKGRSRTEALRIIRNKYEFLHISYDLYMLWYEAIEAVYAAPQVKSLDWWTQALRACVLFLRAHPPPRPQLQPPERK
jgi:hypothetical protein